MSKLGLNLVVLLNTETGDGQKNELNDQIQTIESVRDINTLL